MSADELAYNLAEDLKAKIKEIEAQDDYPNKYDRATVEAFKYVLKEIGHEYA